MPYIQTHTHTHTQHTHTHIKHTHHMQYELAPEEVPVPQRLVCVVLEAGQEKEQKGP